MQTHRLVNSDPIDAVKALIARGIKPHTMLALYTGTKHHANEIRRLLDEQGHYLVGLQFKGELMINLPKDVDEFKPEFVELVSSMFRQTKPLGRPRSVKTKETHDYMIQFMCNGEPVYAQNSVVTEFTRDKEKARVVSLARANQMAIQINRHCNGVALPKVYSIDGASHAVDPGFMDSTRFSTVGIWYNKDGTKRYEA